MKPRRATLLTPGCLAALSLAAVSSAADTNAGQTPDGLSLLPPHPELPPSFWEHHGGWLLPTAILVVSGLAVLGWWWRRPRPPVAVPIEIQVRRALEGLRQQGEDGRTLSEVSRWLRRYFIVAFGLPAEEMTTAEFCRLVRGREELGAELAGALAEFLRRCDELKFAPTQSAAPFEVAARALQLVEVGEARRARQHPAAGTNPASAPDRTS